MCCLPMPTGYETEYVLGDDGAYALVQSRTTVNKASTFRQYWH